MAHRVMGNVDSENRVDADALWNLFTAVSAVGDERERSRLTATGLPSVLQCCFSGLVLVDENEANWTLVAQKDGHEMASARTEQICAELQPFFEMASQGPVLLISAVHDRTMATRFPACIENLGIRSLALAPLRTLHHRLGFVIAGKDSLAGFSREEELILSRLAEHSAISVENLRLNKTLEQDSEDLRKLVGERTQKLQRYTKRLETLQEIDRAVLAADSPQAISQAAMLHIRELVSCLRASVGLFDYEAGKSIVQAINVRGETKLGLGASFPLQVFDLDELRRGDVQMVADAGSLPDESSYKGLKAEGLHSWFSVPLIARGELIGVLNVGSGEVNGFSSEDIEIAREIADSLAIAVQQAQLYDQLERQAVELEHRVAERTAELEAFSYSVSHDLRAPLRAIDGFSRVLMEDHSDKLNPECNRLLNIICSNTRNMGQLIDDLLAFSRLGRQEMRPTEIDMRELAREVFNDLESSEPERKLEVRIEPLPSTRGDWPMIRQVFVNLLSNGIKFTRMRETAIIEVGYETEDSENIYYIKDNGVGFDTRYTDKLFGVFQRLHTSAQFEGTGVGLAIVQSIVKRHGGRVWADAEINEGATIYFSLPRRESKKW